jgi:hypothetical protein
MRSTVSRPLSLSVIAVFAICYGVLTMFPKLMLAVSWGSAPLGRELLGSMSASGPIPLPPSIHVAHGLIGSIVWIVAGICLWKGRSWARWLMALWAFTALLLTYSVAGLAGPLIWKAAVYLVLLGFLFTPAASRYCDARGGGEDA